MAKEKKKNTEERPKYCEVEPKECDGSCGCKNKKGSR